MRPDDRCGAICRHSAPFDHTDANRRREFKLTGAVAWTRL